MVYPGHVAAALFPDNGGALLDALLKPWTPDDGPPWTHTLTGLTPSGAPLCELDHEHDEICGWFGDAPVHTPIRNRLPRA